MSLTVIADEASAINCESHRHFLDRDVMHHLVKGALQECRIDRGKRFHAFGGEAGGKGYRMLLGDADIEATVRELVTKEVEPGPRRHRCRDRDDAVVLFGFGDQRFGEYGGVLWRLRGRLDLRAGDDIELVD